MIDYDLLLCLIAPTLMILYILFICYFGGKEK